MRPRIGLGTGWGRGAFGGGAAAPPATPGQLRATKFINAQTFYGGTLTQEITAEKFVNNQVFHPLAQLALEVTAIGEGALQSPAVEPINAGLVFCLGSHPVGSALLGTDLVSGNAGTLLPSGNLAATNLSHGTWRCLDSTSITNGGAHFPSTSQLRSITTQRTFAFHGNIDAFGTWSALISIPYAAGTWVQPWMSHAFRRQASTGANLNTHAATGGTGYASVNSAGGFTTGIRWFAVTIDGAAGVARFYVDGSQVGGDVGISTAPVDWGANQPVVIFNRSNSSLEEGTDGQCYTAAIWNRVLSQNELAQLVIAPQRMFASSGGPVSLVATKHINAQTFGSHTIVGAGTIQLTATKFVETQIFHSHLVTIAGGTVGPLEPVDSAALGRTITVETSPRQTWIGYGWGAASINMAHWTATNVQRLCEDMGATVVRYFTPETGATFVNNHLAHWNLVRQHGIDTIFSSSFVYRTANPNDVPPNIVGAANGIDVALDSINPSNGWWATLQNEPDGHVDNNPTNDGVGSATQAQIRQHYITFRNRLNTLGRNAVKVLGLEWRHPESMMGEFDDFNANGLFDDGTLQGQCYHIYNKGATDQYYDQRLMTVGPQPGGLDLFSTESGDNGNVNGSMNSPYTAARFISGVNNGGRVEIQHAAIGGVDGDGKVQVLIDAASGTLRNWYAACKIISTHLIRGTRMRLCRSNDRPTSPTMPDNQASRMIIDARTCGCQPRHFVACGRRSDARWVLVAVNHAYDSQVNTTFAGGHYAAPSNPGPNQQLTVTIGELAAVDRVWSGQRASRNGSTTNITVNMRAGIMRFTLAPAETLAITMNAA